MRTKHAVDIKFGTHRCVPPAVRFSQDHVRLPDEELITTTSAIGDIGLKPDESQSDSGGVPCADLDFGMLSKGHTWQASACTLPDGSTLADVHRRGDIVTDVTLQVCPAVEAELQMTDGLESSVKHRVMVTVQPREDGAFEDGVDLKVRSSTGEVQSLSVLVRGIVMSPSQGTPMPKRDVLCIDRAADSDSNSMPSGSRRSGSISNALAQ